MTDTAPIQTARPLAETLSSLRLQPKRPRPRPAFEKWRALRDDPEWRIRRTSFEEPTDEHRNIATQVAGFMLRIFGNDALGKPVLLLSGPTGTGKSHLARAIYQWTQDVAIEAWARGYWGTNPISSGRWEWSELVDQSDGEAFRQACAVDVAVLEDIGGEVDAFKSGAPAEVLRRFLDKREGRFTVMTTNVEPEKYAAKWDARIADRLLAKTTQTISFNQLTSYRLTEGKR